MKKGSDPQARAIKIYVFGAWGTGKTLIIKGLLEHGLKVLCVTTDIGGSGTASVTLALKREGKESLLENLYEIVLNGDAEVQSFLSDPTTFFPDIYEVDLDVIFWDGFSSWQQIDLSEKIGTMPVARKAGEIPQAVEEGLQFETPQWGMLRNATYRAAGKFCALNNVKTGKVWHKFITCQEGYKSKGDNSGGFNETKMPLVQGAGGILMGGAFDLIMRTKATKNVDTGGKDYLYQFDADNAMAKNRGFALPASMPADMYKLWALITEQAGIKKDAISSEEIKGENINE